MRVMVTGMGMLTPIGTGMEAFLDGLKQGKSGVDRITEFDVSHLPSQIAGQVKGFDPLTFLEKRQLKRTDRFAQFGLAAALMAWQDAALDTWQGNRSEIGVYMGTGIGGIGTYEKIYSYLDDRSQKFREAVFAIPRIMNNSVSSIIAERFGLYGFNHTINAACSSGGNAIGLAFEAVRRGSAPLVICGGTEAPIAPKLMNAWSLMRVLSRQNDAPSTASRPFDRDRDGFVMAEGASVLVLESLESALERQVPIYGEIIGFANNCNAGDLTIPELEGQTRVIEKALADAEITPEMIDFINAHGTATPISDRIEAETYHQVFGSRIHHLPISSIKSMTGHAMGASSAISAAATLLSLKHGMIFPTINYQTPDPECDLDVVSHQVRMQEIEIALSASFAFGGNNSILVMKKWQRETI